jgi:hypothetical protein
MPLRRILFEFSKRIGCRNRLMPYENIPSVSIPLSPHFSGLSNWRSNLYIVGEVGRASGLKSKAAELWAMEGLSCNIP